jgi:hypothetical protein
MQSSPSMYASLSMPSPSFSPGIKVDCQQVYSTNADHKVCLWPISKDEVIVADRGGKISKVKLLGDTGCSQAEMFDNNNGKPITDLVRVRGDQTFFIDSDRVQLKESVSKHQSQSVLQNVCADSSSRGKILNFYEKSNQLYVKGNEANTILVVSLDHGSIENEIIISEPAKGRTIAEFSVNPKNGDLLAITTGGDVIFRSTNAARTDAFYRFDGREKERFASVSVDWEAGLLVAVGTQTLEKQNHQHVVYVYDIKDISEIKLVAKSKKWQTKDPQDADTVGHVYLQEIDGHQYICCFTDFTSSLIVFRYTADSQTIELVSYPQKLNKGRTFDVRQAYGRFYACFDGQDLALVNIHSPSFF